MIRKIFLITLFLFCGCKQKQYLLIDKIVVSNDLCENCIGLREMSIHFYFKNNDLFNKKTIKLKTKDTFFYLKNHSKFIPNWVTSKEDYFLYDDIDKSKYGTLREIKKKYSKIFLFNEAYVEETNYILKKNINTKIIYTLNGKEVSENDTIKMNSGLSPPPPPDILEKI